MPELAEVETVRRDVHAEFAGRRIDEVVATGVRTLRRHTGPGEMVGRVTGRRLVGAGRRGKYILLRLDSDDIVVVHLGMSGQLLKARRGQPLAPHTHVTFRFDGGSELRFVDPRTFGEVFVTRGTDPEGSGAGGPGPGIPELRHLGMEPFDEGFAGRLTSLLASRATRLKPLLMDQTRIVGIGNMYADEILFAAGLRHDRPANSLDGAEAAGLAASIVAVLSSAIEHRGSSLADEQYRDLYGVTGRFQLLHQVYGRAGLPCPRCGTEIQRARAAGRSSFFCPSCQI